MVLSEPSQPHEKPFAARTLWGLRRGLEWLADYDAPLWFWVAWFAMLVTMIRYVVRFGLPIPILEDWDNFPYLLGTKKVTLDWLWSLHNEHRIVLPRLVWLGLMRVTLDVRSLMFLNVGLLSLASAVLGLSLRAVRGSTRMTDMFLPLCMMGLAHYMNLLWSFTIQLVLSTALFCFILAFVTVIEKKPAFAVVALPCLLLPLCGASGLILVLPVAVWLALVGIGHPELRNRRAPFFVTSFLVFLMCAAYLAHYENHHPLVTNPADFLRGCTQFLGMSLGADVGARLGRFYLFPLCLLLLSAATLVWTVFKQPEERIRASGLLICTVSCIGLMFSVSLGRADRITLSPRYTTLSAPILCCAYLSFTLYGRKLLSRLIPMILLLTAIAVMPANILAAEKLGQQRLVQYRAFLNDLSTELPLEAIAQRNAFLIYRFDPGEVRGQLQEMIRYGIGPFRSIIHIEKDFPPLIEEEAAYRLADSSQMRLKDGMWHATGRGAFLVYTLAKPRFLYGMRIKFILSDTDPMYRNLHIFWSQWGRNSFTYLQRTVFLRILPGQQEQSETLWIYDGVDSIQIHPLVSETASFKLTKMTLLLLRPSGSSEGSEKTKSSRLVRKD